MADAVFNIAKGRTVEWYNRVESNDPTNSAFTIVLLKAVESDALLEDRDDLSVLLGAAANTEAVFTNYARIELESAELAALPAPDDSNNRYEVDLPDQTFSSAGNGANDTLVKLLICYDNDTFQEGDWDQYWAPDHKKMKEMEN